MPLKLSHENLSWSLENKTKTSATVPWQLYQQLIGSFFIAFIRGTPVALHGHHKVIKALIIGNVCYFF